METETTPIRKEALILNALINIGVISPSEIAEAQKWQLDELLLRLFPSDRSKLPTKEEIRRRVEVTLGIETENTDKIPQETVKELTEESLDLLQEKQIPVKAVIIIGSYADPEKALKKDSDIDTVFVIEKQSPVGEEEEKRIIETVNQVFQALGKKISPSHAYLRVSTLKGAQETPSAKKWLLPHTYIDKNSIIASSDEETRQLIEDVFVETRDKRWIETYPPKIPEDWQSFPYFSSQHHQHSPLVFDEKR